MGARLRFRLLLLVAVCVTAVTSLVVAACGSDNGGGTGNDGGSPESSTTDGPLGNDGNMPSTDGAVGDADADADAGADGAAVLCVGDGGDAGDLDPTFGAGGVTSEAIGGSGVYSVVTQADGKILLGGYVGKLFAIVRLAPTGALDTTFGDAGVVETAISPRSTGIYALAVQGDGKIVAAGAAALDANGDFVVVRYNPSGALDGAFGDAGVTFASFGSDGLPASVAVLSDGHILVTGQAGDPSSAAGTDYAAARFNANGTLDTTFANGGVVTTDIRSSEDRGGSMGLQTDGKFVLVGGSTEEPARLIDDFSAVRYNPDGSLDTTFGVGGKFVSAFGNASQQASGAVIDSTGRIILGGSSTPTGGANAEMALTRLTTTGAVDTSFGSSGIVTTPFAGTNAFISRLLAEPDGKFVGAGFSYPTGGQSSIALVRYGSDGALDPTFGVGGQVVMGVTGYPNVSANGAAFSGCNALIVGGTWDVTAPPTTWMGIARYGL